LAHQLFVLKILQTSFNSENHYAINSDDFVAQLASKERSLFASRQTLSSNLTSSLLLRACTWALFEAA